jgi:protein-disulfide isomerase
MKLIRRARDCFRALLGTTLLLTALTGCAMLTKQDVETVSTVGGHGADPAVARPTTDPRSLGRDDAPIVIVEYSDYQCPYCGKFHANVLPRLQSDYIDTGKVRLIFRDLPLAMHRESVPAAIAAHCAAEQGKFWAMNGALFANQLSLGEELYERLAQTLNLDTDKFSTCVRNPLSRKSVQAGAQEAKRYGLNSTPSFILGRSDKGRVEIHRTARGFVDFETFAREIDSLLATTPASGESLSPVQ